ncbi:urea carboxylase [Nostoc flagelliforme FACHB-838]|uniref:Urea carboxylase n=1 Tax=Nostoc flagelliforme FACHB-838 TaxID=2692904 RepID=A0ABR8DWL3_9NOSO|nr:urea carboxylase [Nostoc flagelliforme]MBD2532799.1 urea carboxylase [Nostoc flagelliforme FACHB-838]
MFNKVLIANRGEIACRIIRTLDRLGIASVAVYSQADAHAAHVAAAGEAVCVGDAAAAQSYLRTEAILTAAQVTGAEAIHPGYGFLSENVDFAEACAAAGIVFIGPTPDQLRRFGLKHEARAIAQAVGVPLVPGSLLLDNLQQVKQAAAEIGYPVMIKSTAGGGGIGMQLCRGEDTLADLFENVQRLSRNNFSQSGVFLEKYIERARHIEVQIFGDGEGNVVALGERDCSTQRRNQKVIEEAPAPNINDALRQRLYESAVKLGEEIRYQSAGTVEFIYDVDSQQFYFLEVNTRLQVEHGVTEAITGVDLVEWMVRQAAGESLELASYQYQPQGHSIQVRVYAEDANKNFQPSSGELTQVQFASGIRCDTWIATGTKVSPFYDPLLAKVIVHGHSREDAIAILQNALAQSRIDGIETNLEYLRQIIADSTFVEGNITTKFTNSFTYRPNTIDVLVPGTMTTIQDYPGRVGYWNIGVPPSGPMDSLAFRLGNRILGNSESAAGLECTLSGPALRFNCDTVICLTGAPMKATLDKQPIPYWTAVSVKAGSTLRLGNIQGNGFRTYISVQGGFDVPDYLGSKATFTLGAFGGHGGRALQVGDVLKLYPFASQEPQPISPELIPSYSNHWEIGVLYGPHGAPDFFTDEDIETFFSTHWEVHYNSARTGIRLIGPKPTWARKDGGEAGLHPSNIHDNAYAVGTVDFTGDMPIILGLDGPSLGGFVCPAAIAAAQLWKIGQLKPGNTIQFHRLTFDQALYQELQLDRQIQRLQVGESMVVMADGSENRAIVAEIPADDQQIAVIYRQASDKYLLIEYGDLVLDLKLRFRVHELMVYLQTNPIDGILELTPGMRSLQIHYDSRVISQSNLVAALQNIESHLPDISNLEVPTRIVHLPLSWDDESTQLAIQKYMQSVRKDAPWCPSNIEFIRRINGLGSIAEVKKIVFNASYLVMGLGDVYLGAPVAVPLDPRHRLVTTKYNPARTWTPENAVGIGGAYLCVYGMEGPGGYQFVGRTVQMWNRYKQTTDFKDGKPWLLRFFDQIRFYPVSHEELMRHQEDFIEGKFKLKIEETTFKFRDYQQFLQEIAQEATTFQTRQRIAFREERDRWTTAQDESTLIAPDLPPADVTTIPDDCYALIAPTMANVWQVLIKVGDRITEDTSVIILEAMKQEMTLLPDDPGTVVEVLCEPGQLVTAGQVLAIIRGEA